MSNLSALVGAIVFAWFPEDENPHQPGPKFRPVIVVDLDHDNKRIRVAYGTSQKVDRCGRGEISFAKGEINGLPKDTKFCLGKSKWIPLTKEYLADGKKSGGVTVLGRVPAKRARDVLHRLQEVAD